MKFEECSKLDKSAAERGNVGRRFFLDLIVGYRSAKIVFTANEIGLFEALRHEGRDARGLARALGCDERGVRILARALVALGILEWKEGQFTNSPLAREHLLSGEPHFVGANLRFQELIWNSWGALSQTVRTGRPLNDLGGLLSTRDGAFTQAYIRGMQDIAEAPAAEIARILGDRPVHRLLDVGGGPGTFAKRLIDAHRGMRATLLDLPTTLEVTRELCGSYVDDGTLVLQPGNYLTDPLARTEDIGGYDLVLMSHITHDESPETNVVLLQKALEALAPGGRLAIHDFVVDADGTGPMFDALFSVNMLAYTKGGQTYSREEYKEMMALVGFRDVVDFDVLKGKVGNPTSLVVGMK